MFSSHAELWFNPKEMENHDKKGSLNIGIKDVEGKMRVIAGLFTFNLFYAEEHHASFEFYLLHFLSSNFSSKKDNSMDNNN